MRDHLIPREVVPNLDIVIERANRGETLERYTNSGPVAYPRNHYPFKSVKGMSRYGCRRSQIALVKDVFAFF